MYDVREGYKIAYSYEDIANILYGKPAMIVNNICILFYLFSCQMSYMTLIKVCPLTSLKKLQTITNNLRIPFHKLSLTLAVYRILSTQSKADGIFKANTV